MSLVEVSVIIPVYNVDKYIRRCVESLLCQTFTNFELILVDDGSTDGSSDICDAYANVDSRVRVIHKSNGGLSSARNAGLDIATGERIIFVVLLGRMTSNCFLTIISIVRLLVLRGLKYCNMLRYDVLDYDSMNDLEQVKTRYSCSATILKAMLRAWKYVIRHATIIRQIFQPVFRKRK